MVNDVIIEWNIFLFIAVSRYDNGIKFSEEFLHCVQKKFP